MATLHFQQTTHATPERLVRGANRLRPTPTQATVTDSYGNHRITRQERTARV
jgi:hypothetical protein